MSRLEALESHTRQRPPRPLEVAADRQRGLLVGALRDEVTAGILAQVARASQALDASRAGLEQTGRQLGKRCLAGPVRADERDDLASADRETAPAEHRPL